MRILILGGDGYLGWPTAMHLSAAGHHVGVADNLARRAFDEELGLSGLVPIAPLGDRVKAWGACTGEQIEVYVGDLTDGAFVHAMFATFSPDAIVHFGEQRSAPYSMIDQRHAVYTQTNNVLGTLNVLYGIAEIDRNIHLVKLGTMGEYGTPNIDIEEGWLTVTHKGRSDTMLYPKRPGSALATRFDYDQVFGTVVNRMVIQAVLGHPLTVYGAGGQTRGLINLVDTVECIRLSCEHPPGSGEFRVFNQFTEQMSVSQIAETVARAYPGDCRIESVDNPRVEAEEHYYRAAHTGLLDLGLVPHLLTETLIDSMFSVVERHRGAVDVETIRPTVRWGATSSELVGPR